MQDTDELAALPRQLADAIREHRDILAAWHGEIDDELEARHHASYAKRDQLCRELLIPRALENATQFSGRLLQAVKRLSNAVAECDLLGMTSRLKRTLGEIAIECREMTSLLWGPFQDCLPYQELDSCAREFLIIRAEDQLPIADYLNRLNLDIMRAVRGDGEPMLSEIRSLASRLVNEVEVITAKPLESVADSEGESTTDATDSVCINDSSSTDSECEITAEEAAAAVDRCNVLRVPIADDETTSKIIHAGCSQLIDAAVQLQQAIEEYEDAKGAVAGFDDLNTDPDAWESREEFASEWLAPLNAPMTLLWDLMRQIPRPQSTSSGPFPPIITESHNTRTEFRAAYLLRTIIANLGKLFTNRGFQPVAVGTFSHDLPIVLGWDSMDFDKQLPELKQFVAPLSRAVQMLTEFKDRGEELFLSGCSQVEESAQASEAAGPESHAAKVDTEYLGKLYADVVRSGRKISSQAKKSRWIPVPDHLIRRHDSRVVSVRLKVESLLLSGKWKSPSTRDLTQSIDGQNELVARAIIERGATNPEFRKFQDEADRLREDSEQLKDVPSDEEQILAQNGFDLSGDESKWLPLIARIIERDLDKIGPVELMQEGVALVERERIRASFSGNSGRQSPNQIPLPPDVDDVAIPEGPRNESPASDADDKFDHDQAGLRQLQIALEDQLAAKRKAAVALRLIELHKLMPLAKKSPKWVSDAIEWIAENGRKPKWAELARVLPVGARTIQDSKHFGSHPKFHEAIDAVQRITSD